RRLGRSVPLPAAAGVRRVRRRLGRWVGGRRGRRGRRLRGGVLPLTASSALGGLVLRGGAGRTGVVAAAFLRARLREGLTRRLGDLAASHTRRVHADLVARHGGGRGDVAHALDRHLLDAAASALLDHFDVRAAVDDDVVLDRDVVIDDLGTV